jgi:hypothetical protein
VTETWQSFCWVLKASAAASPRGKTVVDPDTVTLSSARVVPIDPINRAINSAITILLIILTAAKHHKSIRKSFGYSLYSLYSPVDAALSC